MVKSKYKIELLNFIKSNLGVKSFEEGFKNRHFNIFIERKNEKGQSS